MVIRPNSTITLYSNVNIDNGEQIAFSSPNGQANYFNNRAVLRNVPCTVVRKTGALRIEANAALVSTCNYISFINPSFDNKTIYARIIDYDYVNNECVEIAYVIDYWQTWMFDVRFDPCYIKREHLTQAGAEMAAQNPYDPNLLLLKTKEDLDVSEFTETEFYDIDDSTYGLRAIRASRDITGATSKLGVLIKLASLDFKKMDDAYFEDHPRVPGAPSWWVNVPSWKYVQCLIEIKDQDFGFFYISQSDYDYFAGLYGDVWSSEITDKIMLGNGWTDASLTPFQETSYTPPLTYIYDENGADESASVISKLLTTLVGYETELQMVNNTVVGLNIIPNDVMMMAGDTEGRGPFRIFSTPQLPPGYSGTINPKLYRYPYCYLRVICPNGDIKELHYEDFVNILRGDNRQASLYISMDLTDTPTLIVAPSNYKYTSMSENEDVDTNINEAVFLAQFPTLPYNIDAFTAQCAAVVNSTIGSRTTDAMFEMSKADLQYNTELGEWGTKSNSFLSNAGKVAGSANEYVAAANMATGALSYGMTSDMFDLTQKQIRAREAMMGVSTTALADPNGSEVANQLNFTKPAYVADHYHPSNGVGMINFNKLSFCDIVVVCAVMNREILQAYNYYFTFYGYASGLVGIPNVCRYVAGESAAALLPQWVSTEYEPNKYFTYIQTVGCKVHSAMLPVASAIEDMFDNGVRMIKGD